MTNQVKVRIKTFRLLQGLLISLAISIVSIVTIGVTVPLKVLTLIGIGRFVYCMSIWLIYFYCLSYKFRQSFLTLIFYIIVCLILALPLIPYNILVNQITSYYYPPFAIRAQTEINKWYYYTHFYLLRSVIMSVSVFIIQYREDIIEEKQAVKFKNEQLSQQNLMMQLEALRQQISPHFLFNTLSALKTLIKDNPEQAEFYTFELSNVYRYLLNHHKQKTTTLKKEIQFLKSYLSLLKIRFENNYVVEIDIPEKYSSYEIPPLSLQLLIENTVKHNIITKDHPLNVNIFVDNLERIVVENAIQKRANINEKSQYGLFHLSEHYKMLTGKDIEIRATSCLFSVHLPLIIPK